MIPRTASTRSYRRWLPSSGERHQATKLGKPDPSGLESLTSMIGYYRTIKQSHDPREIESMIREYNQAIESANTFGRLG